MNKEQKKRKVCSKKQKKNIQNMKLFYNFELKKQNIIS